MSLLLETDHSPSELLELPGTWLAHLFQHVASGSGGLISAAALSQTCKSFYALSESSAVTYRNLQVEKPLLSLGHPFWPWLAKRHSRIAGLTAEVRLLGWVAGNPEPEPEQLQVMFRIPGLCLTLCCCEGMAYTPDAPFMTKVLRPHAHLVDQLISIVRLERDGVILQDFCEAAAPCRSLDLTVVNSPGEPVNFSALSPVAGSLVRLSLAGMTILPRNELESVSSLSSLSHLTSLCMSSYDLGAKEPWIHLLGLTNLKQLSLWMAASGDPSPLSALTGLSSLRLHSYELQGGLPPPCTFSSLQPLSTLQQLSVLALYAEACTATPLHGLAGLSRLESVRLSAPRLRSFEGLSTGLTSLVIANAPQLETLAGIERLQGLQILSVCSSGVSSLHPLAALYRLKDLRIGGTFASLAGLEGTLRTCLQSLTLDSCKQLRQLSGIEGLTALQQLVISLCEVTSLQPVGQLVGFLEKLHVIECRVVQDKVLELPHIQPTADVRVEYSNVREVVLAGGVRRMVPVDFPWIESSSEEQEEEEGAVE